YITFTVTPSAAAGDTYVITALEKGLDGTHGIISTADSRSVEYNMSNGAIIIKENPVYGDINQDGKTTITDAVALQKYLITLKTLTSEQLSLADINGDGRVNTFDLSLLKQLLK
ncbi:MAG: dockerin type I repeat-containing protein, partial [Ruminococcus sp.]